MERILHPGQTDEQNRTNEESTPWIKYAPIATVACVTKPSETINHHERESSKFDHCIDYMEVLTEEQREKILRCEHAGLPPDCECYATIQPQQLVTRHWERFHYPAVFERSHKCSEEETYSETAWGIAAEMRRSQAVEAEFEHGSEGSQDNSGVVTAAATGRRTTVTHGRVLRTSTTENTCDTGCPRFHIDMDTLDTPTAAIAWQMRHYYHNNRAGLPRVPPTEAAAEYFRDMSNPAAKGLRSVKLDQHLRKLQSSLKLGKYPGSYEFRVYASKFASECRALESHQPQRDSLETAQGGPKQQTLTDAVVRGGRAHTERAVYPGAKMQRKLADENSTALHTIATDGSHHPATTTASSRTSWGFVTRTQTMLQKGLQPDEGCGQVCHLDLEACIGKGEFEAVLMALRNSSVSTPIHFIVDALYVITTCTQIMAQVANDYEPSQHQKLQQQLHPQREQFRMLMKETRRAGTALPTFEHVHSHTGEDTKEVRFNDRADEAAGMGHKVPHPDPNGKEGQPMMYCSASANRLPFDNPIREIVHAAAQLERLRNLQAVPRHGQLFRGDTDLQLVRDRNHDRYMKPNTSTTAVKAMLQVLPTVKQQIKTKQMSDSLPYLGPTCPVCEMLDQEELMKNVLDSEYAPRCVHRREDAIHVAVGECVQDQWLACRRAVADELNTVCHKRHSNANHSASAFDSSPLVWRENLHLQWMNAGIRGNLRKYNYHDNDHTDPQSDLPSPTIPSNLHKRSDTFMLRALNNSNPVRTLFGAPSVLLAECVQRVYRKVITAKEVWAIAHRHIMATIESVLRTQKEQRRDAQIKYAATHELAPDFPFYSTLQAKDRKKRKNKDLAQEMKGDDAFIKKKRRKKARNTPKQQRKERASQGPSPSATGCTTSTQTQAAL